MTSPTAVHRRAGHIRDALTGNVELTAGTVHTSVSVGVIIDEGTSSASNLLADADATVSLAKRRGRGRIEVFDHRVHDQVVTRLATEMELRAGLEARQFVLHYQPVIDLKVGGMSAVEALVRWEHPRYGLLGPDAFLPVVGGVRTRQATRLVGARRGHPSRGALGEPVEADASRAVNISADQLSAEDFRTRPEHDRRRRAHRRADRPGGDRRNRDGGSCLDGFHPGRVARLRARARSTTSAPATRR